jgi:NAD(P)-dependent dehydrogenase (short-subunit alcohol dehydrogenase family)
MAATKVALITASSAGLGAQIARVFAPDFRVVRYSNLTYTASLEYITSLEHTASFKHTTNV